MNITLCLWNIGEIYAKRDPSHILRFITTHLRKENVIPEISHVGYIKKFVILSCLTSLISLLLSHVSCLTTPVSDLLSHVSCLKSPVSQLLFWFVAFYTNYSEWVGGAVGRWWEVMQEVTGVMIVLPQNLFAINAGKCSQNTKNFRN